MNNIFIFILLVALVVGCEKPNPTPENMDPVFQELQKELASLESTLVADEKQLDELKKALEGVVPQTGQIKFAQKRVFEQSARIEKTKQMIKYYRIKIESRRKLDRDQYMAAYTQKAPWPDPREFKEYQANKKLQDAPRIWDNKRRIKEAELPKEIKSPGGGGGH